MISIYITRLYIKNCVFCQRIYRFKGLKIMKIYRRHPNCRYPYLKPLLPNNSNVSTFILLTRANERSLRTL
jgi:hypothetical protein